MYIAAIPLDQKKAVVDTQQTWSVSKMENAKAEADFNESTTQVQVARNDLKATQLSVDSAITSKKSADQSADTNRMNNAQRDLHTAEDLKKAAEARVKYLDAYHAYLKRYWRYTQENMYWQEAQYEQAKGQIAKQNNIAPKGVQYDAFPKQVDERGKRTQSAKERAEKEKIGVVTAREAWLKLQGEADKESGHPTSFWDPMAPKTGPATAGNASGTTSVISPGSAPTANPPPSGTPNP